MKINKIILMAFSPIIFASCSDSDNGKGTPEQSGFKAIDTANMDLAVKPGDNFFNYVNGRWCANNPIPDDKSVYGSFHQLDEENNNKLKTLFEESLQANAPQGSDMQKMADFYKSGLDTATIANLGINPIQPWLDKIAAAKNTEDIQTLIAEMHKIQIFPFFYIYAAQDEKNSTMVIGQVMQGGIGLPDRDYYLSDDEQSAMLRQEYVNYVQKMLELIGYSSDDAKKGAENILSFETSLAESSMTMLERRDPHAQYNKMTVEELQQKAPGFDWKQYLTVIGLPELKTLNINQPVFVEKVGKLISTTPVETLKAYLKFNLINSLASYLTPDFEAAQFNFYGTVLSGRTKMKDRWKRVIDAANGNIGEIVGKVYVEKYFPAEAKTRMLELVKNLKGSLKEHIENLAWMTEPTRQKAVEKLEAMNLKIGYPDKWIDYSKLEIKSGAYFENVLAARSFDFNRNINEIDKPVDRDKWDMTPQTVNAYYSPTMNEVVFPAAILQAPFFSLDADDAVNYGGIGAVIGHEMTHGFDDQGRLYDKNGNLADWWTAEDAENFKKQTEPLITAYDNFAILDTLHVNGKLTLGENIADLGGISVSLTAFKKTLKGDEKDIDGFNPIQRYFISFGQIWRQNIRPQELKRRLKEDVHSPALARVNEIVYQLNDFYTVFNIKEGDKSFIPESNRIKIW